MRKLVLILVLLLIATICFLCSCSLGGRGMIFNDDNKKANDRLEQIIAIINDKDKEMLKELFSSKALNDADDFEENLDKLFGFIQGEINSWEKPSGPTVFESNNYGHRTKQVNSYYYVMTEKQKIFFLIRDFPVDTDNPDNVGLYLLLAVRAENEEKIYDADQKVLYDGEEKLSRAGIYIPFD